MILVDTSIWIDHIRKPDEALTALLVGGDVIQHSFVTAEVALGSLANRERMVRQLQALPAAVEVDQAALIAFIDRAQLSSKGIGFVDAHLLASAANGEGVTIWTRDKRLASQAERLGIAYKD